MFLTNPVSFIGENKLSKIELIKMELGDKDESGRRSFNEIKDSNFILDADLVVLAISSTGDINSIQNLKNNRILCVLRSEIIAKVILIDLYRRT